MSFRKLKTEYHVHCDAQGCLSSLNTQVRASKISAWHVAKLRGWMIRRIGIMWRHYCSIGCYNAPVDKAPEADQGAAS